MRISDWSSDVCSSDLFLDNVQAGRVTSVTIQGSDITGVDADGRSFTTRATDNLDGLVPTLRDGGVNFTVKPVENNSFLSSLLISWLPMLLLIGVWIFFMRQMQGGGGKEIGRAHVRTPVTNAHLGYNILLEK